MLRVSPPIASRITQPQGMAPRPLTAILGANFNGNSRWVKEAGKLVGKTIANVRWMSSAEAVRYADRDLQFQGRCWAHLPPVIEFTDGTLCFPVRDDEGNDGGALGGCVELPVTH